MGGRGSRGPRPAAQAVTPTLLPSYNARSTHINWNAENNELSRRLINADRVGELLDALGCELHHDPGSDVYRGRCPVHGEEKSGRNFKLRTGGDSLPIYWSCYSHHYERDPLKPNLLGLVRGVRGGSLHDAVKYVKDFLGQGGGDGKAAKPRPRPPAAEKKAANQLALTREYVRRRWQAPSAYFRGRGFCPKVLDELDVRHSEEGKSVVPLYDDADKLCVGFMLRSEWPLCAKCGLHHGGEDCRFAHKAWKVFPEKFPKSSYLYGYAAARRHPSWMVLLVEGIPEVFRAREAGLPAVAILGSKLYDEQARKLAALRKSVMVCLDADQQGTIGGYEAVRLLSDRRVHVSPCQVPAPHKDIGDMPAAQLRVWLGPTFGLAG